MASQSEIFLANSTGEPHTEKSRKPRTRRKEAAKSAKNPASRATSKPANENKTAESDVVPMMKLSAIDIAGNGLLDSGAPIIKVPGTTQSPAIVENEIDETQAAQENGKGSDYSENMDDADAVTDPELLELLEQLSVTIDSANTVLDAAATDSGTVAAGPNPIPAVVPEPMPEPDVETDDPPPLAAQFASLSPTPEPPLNHEPNSGISKVTTAILTGLALTAGFGWLLYTNPWLMDDGSKVAMVPDTSAKATLNQRTAPRLANVAPAVVPVPTRSDTVRAAPPIKRQPVMAPIVSIGQPVSGKVGQPIMLAINLPANTSQTEMSIMIQGVPDKTRLSTGKSLGSGNWLLSEAELKGLTLKAAASFVPARFNLDVILVRSDGKVPEVHKLPVTIAPAATARIKTPDNGAGPPSSATTYIQTGVTVAVPAAPAPKLVAPSPATPSKVAAKPAPIRAAPPVRSAPLTKSAPIPTITRAEVRALLTRANSLLEQGDVAGARLLLEYAAQHGSKRAMLKMGETYDPDHLSKLGVRGAFLDQDKAALWYDRAAKALAAQ